MDDLADFEDVLSERRVNDEDFPRTGHKDAPEDCRHDEDDTHVEDDEVGCVVREKAWHHFLLKEDETES